VREAAEGYVTILNGCCRFLRKQNRTEQVEKKAKKERKRREKQLREKRIRERERGRERKLYEGKITLCFNTVVCDAF
jgi:hypothetical protein